MPKGKMVIHGIEITEAQQAAGVAAMKGLFTKHDVEHAMARAGVPFSIGERLEFRHILERAGDRLLQRQRKAGLVRAVTTRQWQEVPQAEPASE